MMDVIEIIKLIPRSIILYFCIGSKLVSYHKASMKNGGKVSLNKKRHLYHRIIEFNIRGYILSCILYYISINIIPEGVNRLSYKLLELSNSENDMGMYLQYYYVYMVIVLFILTVIIITYQAWSFKLNLYGFDKYNKKEMIRCMWTVLTTTLIGCSSSLIYLITQKEIFSIVLLLIILTVILIDAVIRIWVIPKYNIYSFVASNKCNINNSVDITKDIRIQSSNPSEQIKIVNLCEQTMIIQNDDNILLVNNKDRYDVQSYKKEDIKYIRIKNDRLEYTNNKWQRTV